MHGKTWWCTIAVLVAMSGGVCWGQAKRPGVEPNRLEKRLAELLQEHERVLRVSGDLARRMDEVVKELDKVLKSRAGFAAPVADRKGEEGFRALYTIDRDGSNVRFLAAAPGMICSSSPEWSHNGWVVAFDAVPRVGDLGDARLFVYAVEGPFKGTFKDLGCGNVPSWSPDDRKIAFMVNPGNPCQTKPGIWIMDADGSNRQWICNGWYPRWSPDGKQLHVYASFEQPACIHLVDVKSRKIRKVLGENMEVEFGGGTWSPDGKRIALVGTRDGKRHLATVAVDGDWGSIRVLYSEENSKRELIGPPAWSPDGKQIVLAVQHNDAPNPNNRRWGNTHLYSLSGEVPSAPARLERDGKGLINRSPMWSPDSRGVVFSSER